jgi:hypothetical protein
MRGFGADQRCAGRAWTRGGGAVALLSLPHWHQLHGLGVAHAVACSAASQTVVCWCTI